MTTNTTERRNEAPAGTMAARRSKPQTDSPAVPVDPVHILSLGAGVQSSTLALMAAAGLVTPMPIAAIFADTQAEPPSVYRWLDWLETKLPFPVHRVTAGDLEADATRMRVSKKGRKYSRTAIPFFTLSAQGKQGRIMHRTCTRDFKIVPLMKKARQLAGIKRGQKTVGVVQWIGISLDEMLRCKPSRGPWAKSRWPLIELRMTRAACLEWMRVNGFPEPPRLACVFCPFHSNAEWRRLKDKEPAEFDGPAEVEVVDHRDPEVSNPSGPCSHCGNPDHWRPDCPELRPSLPQATADPSPPPANPDAWRAAPIADLGLPPKLAERLAENGITTIGQLEDKRAEGSMPGAGLRSIKGIGTAKIDAIEDAVVAWLSRNRDAGVLAAVSTPPSPLAPLPPYVSGDTASG